MVSVENNGNMNQSNGDQNEDVISDNFPGGQQQQQPQEPTFSEGCASSNTASDDLNVITPPAKGDQAKSNAAQKGSEKRTESSQQTANGQTTKKTKHNENQPKKSEDGKTSVQSTTNNDENDDISDTSRASSTRSHVRPLSKIRITFDDTDDEDSRYSSYSKQDILEYRNHYPHARSNPRITDNLDFYTNKISSHPDGDFIDNIHKDWYKNYRKLEFHHGYIQWLFPLQEQGLNWSAEPLQKHEIESIKKDKKALGRILVSYKLMLDFYGFKLVDETTGEIRRDSDTYKDRFRNLNTSSHNYLRITRILKCLGEFGYEDLKFPFLERILYESIIEDTLPNCLRSCKDYWIETLRSQKERRAIRQYARELLDYRHKGIQPPATFRATRPPPPTSATTKQIKNLSLSKQTADDNNLNSNE